MDPARTLLPGDDEWPARLSSIPDPPAQLRVRGRLGREREPRVAIVGSRIADAYGLELTREIARDLARAGVCVVSGGAAGVDAAAHVATLDEGGRSIAVLGTGVDVAYPAAHRGLFERIVASGGALVSELEDGTPAARWTFPKRNRIVSALSDAVLVTRAAERSGALITADWARRQGVPVLALPGDVREEGSAGPVGLLRTGAKAVASARDVLDVVGLRGQLELPATSAARQDDLAPEESTVLAALDRSPRHADEVARAAGVAVAAALPALLLLELRGLCEQRPGHYFLRRA